MDDQSITAWYSLEWFSISNMQSFSWDNPAFLWAMLAIPLIFVLRWFMRYYYSQKLPVAVASRDLKSSPVNLIRLIPEILLMVVFALILTALARPQKTNEKVEQWTEG